MSSAYSILRTIARYHLLFIVIFSIIILSKIAWQSKYIIGPLGTFSSRIARWNVTTRPPELPEGLLGYEEISELYRSFEEKSRQIADAVAALRNSEELFRQLAENIRDVFWVYNLNKQAIEYISPGYEEIWGRRRDDLYLKPESFMENVYPEDAEKIMEAKGLLLKGSFSSVQFRILRPDGSFRWIWARTYPVADGNGKFFRMTGIAEDITGRKLAESLLSIQRDLGIALSSCANLDDALQVIIDSVLRMEGIDAGGIYLVGDADGSIELACSSGLSDDFAALVRHYDGNSRNARIIMEGNPVYFEFSEQAAERTGIIGQEINLPEGIKSLAVLPIRHMGASIACLNAASKTYPAIPSSSRDSLEAIASLLGSTIVRIKTQEQIHSSLREKEVLLKEVHHRVKNNFQIIMSLLNLQSRNIKDDAQLRYFYELRNRITAMALIHEKLYQSGNFASINFPAYILSLSTELRRIYHDPGREVEFKMEADDIDISLDQAIPCSLIMNEILSNALKYAFPPTFENNARITVTIRRAGEGEVELSVSDNGVGIPGHIEPRNTATLGISLIDVLSSQINGNVHIDSSTEGTRFTIRFTPK
jgi:PAS domain S-box-containing protein